MALSRFDSYQYLILVLIKLLYRSLEDLKLCATELVDSVSCFCVDYFYRFLCRCRPNRIYFHSRTWLSVTALPLLVVKPFENISVTTQIASTISDSYNYNYIPISMNKISDLVMILFTIWFARTTDIFLPSSKLIMCDNQQISMSVNFIRRYL